MLIRNKYIYMQISGGLDQVEASPIVLFLLHKSSLNANEITKQFLDVLIAYESIGVKINVLVYDGGGANESF